MAPEEEREAFSSRFKLFAALPLIRFRFVAFVVLKMARDALRPSAVRYQMNESVGGDVMKRLIGLFAIGIAFGSSRPAQALPNVIEDKGVTYVAKSETRRVSGLITSTGATIWTTQLLAPADITLSLALDKDVLYVTGYSETIAPNLGFVWAVDAATGQILWVTSNLPGGGIYSSATVSKGVVYVAGAAGGTLSRTSALSAETGAIIWQSNTTRPVFSSPSIAKDGVVLASGGFPGFPTFVILLDATTGALVYAIPAP